MTKDQSDISRVTRSKAAAKVSYDRMSRWYDWLAGSSEWKFVKVGLELLDAKQGEQMLEIGFGTGKAILALARAVGERGRVDGIDLSQGMLKTASERVEAAGLSDRVVLRLGDAATLPYQSDSFDAVFTSFTLELFDTPEIPIVLQECRRVLRDGGRLVAVSMAKRPDSNLITHLYEWFHERFPAYADCRPIYVKQSLSQAGFQISDKIELKMWGLPVEAVLGRSRALDRSIKE